jgi:hypothetical protein
MVRFSKNICVSRSQNDRDFLLSKIKNQTELGFDNYFSICIKLLILKFQDMSENRYTSEVEKLKSLKKSK